MSVEGSPISGYLYAVVIGALAVALVVMVPLAVRRQIYALERDCSRLAVERSRARRSA